MQKTQPSSHPNIATPAIFLLMSYLLSQYEQGFGQQIGFHYSDHTAKPHNKSATWLAWNEVSCGFEAGGSARHTSMTPGVFPGPTIRELPTRWSDDSRQSAPSGAGRGSNAPDVNSVAMHESDVSPKLSRAGCLESGSSVLLPWNVRDNSETACGGIAGQACLFCATKEQPVPVHLPKSQHPAISP